MLLLGRRIPLDPLLDVGDLEVLQRGPGSRHPRPARHHLLVHRRAEPLGRVARLVADVAPVALHQLLQRLPPGQLVWRVDQHTIHIEDAASVRHHAHHSSGLP
jgi:hypothetical protein